MPAEPPGVDIPDPAGLPHRGAGKAGAEPDDKRPGLAIREVDLEDPIVEGIGLHRRWEGKESPGERPLTVAVPPAYPLDLCPRGIEAVGVELVQSPSGDIGVGFAAQVGEEEEIRLPRGHIELDPLLPGDHVLFGVKAGLYGDGDGDAGPSGRQTYPHDEKQDKDPFHLPPRGLKIPPAPPEAG